MATYGLDVECPHSFDGTHFARWRNWMQCNFMFISPQMWWMVDVGFSHVLDENDLTQAQEKCLDLYIQATNIIYRSLDDCIFGEIIDMKTAHEIWVFLNEKYGAISDDDDDVPKVEAHEDVEHDHNTVVVEDCSTSWSSDDDDRSTTSSLDKIDDNATSDTNDDTTPCTLDGEGDGSCSSHDYDATTSPSTTPHSFMSHGDTKVYNANVVDHVVSYDELTTCEQQKHLLYVTTCSHEKLKLIHEELCVAHDNLVKDYAFLTKKLSNEEIKTSESSSLGSNDQSHSVTNPCDVGKKHVSTSCDDLLSMPCSSHIYTRSTSMSCETNLLRENNDLNEQVKKLSNKLERNYGDKCGLGFKKKMTKGERKQEKRIKKLHQKKLSHTMCYRCREVGHLANGCPNIKKLKKMKEEERLKHVKCFKCCTWGHLISMCPTKQLVKQQVKPQPKPQVEQEKTPQAQVKINHHGDDLMMKKKKTRRDAKMMSKNQDKKKAYTHIKCFVCKNDGHFASKCPTKLEKKAQATLKRQGNEKQHMSKEGSIKEKLLLMPGKGTHDDNTMIRKDGNGTSMVAIAKHPATHNKASPKYVAPNVRGPKLVWVPSKSG
ncbi:hypothetical protein BDA96_09G103600 [Sorghum bicolor]|uniref:CCHC-type domain-containing protein n=1 Tax=Sorghum bicolor TaxID=4558 RepID=A0A921U3Q3_SORBI|nr:hypothetical protein BDA96_09G103600 [Sorghum bicolor]